VTSTSAFAEGKFVVGRGEGKTQGWAEPAPWGAPAPKREPTIRRAGELPEGDQGWVVVGRRDQWVEGWIGRIVAGARLGRFGRAPGGLSGSENFPEWFGPWERRAWLPRWVGSLTPISAPRASRGHASNSLRAGQFLQIDEGRKAIQKKFL